MMKFNVEATKPFDIKLEDFDEFSTLKLRLAYLQSLRYVWALIRDETQEEVPINCNYIDEQIKSIKEQIKNYKHGDTSIEV